MNANLAFAPINGTNALYTTTGVDFLMDHDIAAGDKTRGEAEFVEWVEFDGDDFDQAAADDIIRGKGFRRVGDWDFTLNDYAACTIEAA